MPDRDDADGGDSDERATADEPATTGDSTDRAARADAARERVLDSHAETVEAVLRCADAVAESWDRDYATDRREVADPLRAELDAAGAWSHLPDVLADAVRATGASLEATPVAAPPYVAATSRGPMLRATLPAGRLVVLLRAFEIERGLDPDSDSDGSGPDSDPDDFDPNSDSDGSAPIRYRRGPATPAEAVRATFK